MTKRIIAFILGLVSFFLMFALGESFGIKVAFLGIGTYYLISQYFLSHGNPKALFKDWLIILSLNATLTSCSHFDFIIRIKRQDAIISCSYFDYIFSYRSRTGSVVSKKK